MSGVGVPEKVLRQSQSIRCLENVRRDGEVSELDWTSTIYGEADMLRIGGRTVPRQHLMLIPHEALGDRKAKTHFEKNWEGSAYTAMTSGAYVLARGTLSLILKRMDP